VAAGSDGGQGGGTGVKWRIGVAGGAAALTLAGLLGTFFGLGVFTFVYGEGFSYFSTEPEACTNCHIMQPYYDSWVKASHHGRAACVDCHLPDSFVPKYIAKADNGFRHSWAFTFMDFHEPIQITERNAEILQENCVRCHEAVTAQMAAGAPSLEDVETIRCVHCHSDVGHGGE